MQIGLIFVVCFAATFAANGVYATISQRNATNSNMTDASRLLQEMKSIKTSIAEVKTSVSSIETDVSSIETDVS